MEGRGRGDGSAGSIGVGEYILRSRGQKELVIYLLLSLCYVCFGGSKPCWLTPLLSRNEPNRCPNIWTGAD